MRLQSRFATPQNFHLQLPRVSPCQFSSLKGASIQANDSTFLPDPRRLPTPCRTVRLTSLIFREHDKSAAACWKKCVKTPVEPCTLNLVHCGNVGLQYNAPCGRPQFRNRGKRDEVDIITLLRSRIPAGVLHGFRKLATLLQLISIIP